MKPPLKPGSSKTASAPDRHSSSGEVAAFVQKARAMTRATGEDGGRLIFALDATMSRQPTWDMACSLQAEMFKAVDASALLQVQLVYFRGHGECRASKWVADTGALADLMSGLQVRGGMTQIGKVLAHARTEHKKRRVNALVYVGDAMEEDVDRLAHKAAELGMLGCPLFIFQEGDNRSVETAFREFARLSKGAYARFNSGAAGQLAELLKAVAAYASGGKSALKLQPSASAKALLEQL